VAHRGDGVHERAVDEAMHRLDTLRRIFDVRGRGADVDGLLDLGRDAHRRRHDRAEEGREDPPRRRDRERGERDRERDPERTERDRKRLASLHPNRPRDARDDAATRHDEIAVMTSDRRDRNDRHAGLEREACIASSIAEADFAVRSERAA